MKLMKLIKLPLDFIINESVDFGRSESSYREYNKAIVIKFEKPYMNTSYSLGCADYHEIRRRRK